MKQFQVLHKDGKARVGLLMTPHGVIDTPNFIPVGTQATVKALGPRELKEIGAQVVLANTYHLMLRPGADLIEKFGGLHKFMGWDKPIMTDSGGFQVFSLGIALEHGNSKVVGKMDNKRSLRSNDLGQLTMDNFKTRPRLNKITEEGVTFQSHLDGSKHILTPEKSIEIQHKLGADLIVAFDDHESAKHTKAEMVKSLELTENWGLRSKAAHDKICDGRRENCQQLLYGVVHGGTHKDLRIRSARFTDENFGAIAIGGIYGDKKTLCKIVEWVVGEVSEDKPKHLLGIGEVEDLFNGVERGMDFFDCVAPMRRARFGSLYISPNSFINIRQSKFTADKNPIDPVCNCYTCQNFSRAYLRHLYMADEILYHQLATYHNVYFVINLMRNIREAIIEGRLQNLKKSYGL